MSEALETPLEPFAAEPAAGCATAKVFLKREDLLPYGGGNKVRRLLAWLEELSDRDQRTIAVLSYRGSHTFLALAELMRSPPPVTLRYGPLAGRKLLFWECHRPATAYTETIRQRYCDQPGITIVPGSTPSLLARMTWANVFGRRNLHVLPIGGSIAPRRPPYREPLAQCAAQLASAGHTGRVWHLVPASSGTMLAGLAQSIADAGYHNHRLICVLTGPRIARRLVARKHRANDRIILLPTHPLAWEDYLPLATAFHNRTGIWPDPMHMIHSLQALDHLPAAVSPHDALICWITSPRVDGPLV